MHNLLFLAFTLVTAVPLAGLAIWTGQSALQNEIDSVRERHLLVARNLTSTLSRYVKDVNAVFALTFASGSITQPAAGLAELLRSLNVIHVCVLNADGSTNAILPGLSAPGSVNRISDERFKILRSLADDTANETVLSKLYHDPSGRPVFYLVKALPDGKMGLGVLSTSYLVSLQQAIAFGDHGHAVITDAKGQVIAHPLKDWVAASRDISGVSAVAAMMRGETGVGQFYSPAFNGMMIAGYAVVPETGWGVMVPQPMSELTRRANLVNHLAVIVAVVAFLVSALISYLFAVWLSSPVRRIAATAEAVMLGNEHVSAPVFGPWAPSELRGLGLGFNTMLTELRRRAADTLRALREVETSNRAKTRFLANMSHELRTPLNGVVGMLELLKLSGVSRAQSNYIDQANRSAQTLLRVVNDVLDLSELEVDGIALKLSPFNLDALLETVRRHFADAAEAKGLNLVATVSAPSRGSLIGDSNRLARLLGCLVDNAIKFTSGGGVSIRAATSEIRPGWTQVRFEVGDTGIGIPGDAQQRIFDAFTQGDNSSTRRHSGGGLGLAIVKELAQRMKGEIGVQSIVGVGSTFWVSLPFENAPEDLDRRPISVVTPSTPSVQTQAPAASATQRPARPMPTVTTAVGLQFQKVLEEMGRTTVRILLVEDNAANARVTRALLETLGCQVRTAANGLESVAAYQEETFDIVLMDCQMPEMDGYQATRAIRQIEERIGRVTPIVALTAHAMDGTREECLAAGMDDQLSKPMTLAALTAKLTQWLSPAPHVPG